MSDIREQYETIQSELRQHDAARKLIEAKLLALQHVCPHTNATQWHDSGWGRMPSDEWHCKDCGLHRST